MGSQWVKKKKKAVGGKKSGRHKWGTFWLFLCRPPFESFRSQEERIWWSIIHQYYLRCWSRCKRWIHFQTHSSVLPGFSAPSTIYSMWWLIGTSLSKDIFHSHDGIVVMLSGPDSSKQVTGPEITWSCSPSKVPMVYCLLVRCKEAVHTGHQWVTLIRLAASFITSIRRRGSGLTPENNSSRNKLDAP